MLIRNHFFDDESIDDDQLCVKIEGMRKYSGGQNGGSRLACLHKQREYLKIILDINGKLLYF